MSILEAGISWLTPPLCVGCGVEGSAVCTDCSKANILPFGPRCWRCNALSQSSRTCPTCRQTGCPSYVWVSTIYDGLAKDLVRKYKFGQLRVAALPISQIMSDTHFAYSPKPVNYLIVPVPTATKRIRLRGFDHCVLLAKYLARQLDTNYVPSLCRLGQASQVGQGRTDRLKQTSGQYYVRWPHIVSGQNILLIDDVVTTGGTLIAATQALRKAGAASVDALVFAKRL